MAPRFVLLEHRVRFVAGVGGLTGGEGEEEAGKPEVTEALQAMKPDLSVLKPPQVSSLLMVEQKKGVPLGGGLISSTDKALVVLLTGQYCPGFTRSESIGGYLVYDASTDSLSAVPQIPSSPSFRNLGRGTAILSRGRGAYLLAELGISDLDGVLYLWQCTGPDQGQSKWDRKLGRLPSQVVDDLPFFRVDTVFSYAGSSICWVDLLKGVLVCDLLKAAEEEPEFTFVPLPRGYSMDVGRRPRPRPEQFRTMSCVNGVIKFVALVGLYEKNVAIDNVMLKTWTLSHDLKEWKLACDPLAVEDLWASFREHDLPKIPPMFPVLSCDEDEVVYLSLIELEHKKVYDIRGRVQGVEVAKKARHILRVDVTQSKVLDCTKITQGTLLSLHWPTVLATEFTSYLHGCKDNDEGVREASVAGTSRKHVSH